MKPENLFYNGPEGGLKVGDFGLSRRWNPLRAMTLQMVTRWYRAPELEEQPQSFAWAPSGNTFVFGDEARTLLDDNSDMGQYDSGIDIFSAGCCAWEMLTCHVLLPSQEDGKAHIHTVRSAVGTMSSTFVERTESLYSRLLALLEDGDTGRRRLGHRYRQRRNPDDVDVPPISAAALLAAMISYDARCRPTAASAAMRLENL